MGWDDFIPFEGIMVTIIFHFYNTTVNNKKILR